MMNTGARDQAPKTEFDRTQGAPTELERARDVRGVRGLGSSVHGDGLAVEHGKAGRVLRHQTLSEIDEDWS